MGHPSQIRDQYPHRVYTTDRSNPHPSHIAQTATSHYPHPTSSGIYQQIRPATPRLDPHSMRTSMTASPGPLSEAHGRSLPVRHVDPYAQSQRQQLSEPSYPFVSRSPIMARHRSDMGHSVSDMSLRPRSISTNLQSRVMAEDDERTPVARFNQPMSHPSTPSGMAMGYPDDLDPANISSKYECDYCGKGFNRPSSLKVRAHVTTVMITFSMTPCRSTSTAILETSVSTIKCLSDTFRLLTIFSSAFVCPVESCGRSFSVLSNMRRHARVHSIPPLPQGNEMPFSSSTSTTSAPTASSSSATPSASSSRVVASPERWQYRRDSVTSGSSSSTSTSERSQSRSSNEDEDTEEAAP